MEDGEVGAVGEEGEERSVIVIAAVGGRPHQSPLDHNQRGMGQPAVAAVETVQDIEVRAVGADGKDSPLAGVGEIDNGSV